MSLFWVLWPTETHWVGEQADDIPWEWLEMKLVKLEQISASDLELGELQTQRVGDLEMCFANLFWSKQEVLPSTEVAWAGRGEDAMLECNLFPRCNWAKSLGNESEENCFSNLWSHPDGHPCTLPLRNLLKCDNFRIWVVAVLGKSWGPKSDLPGQWANDHDIAQYAVHITQYVPIHIAKSLITSLEAGNKTLQVGQRVTLLDRSCCLNRCLVRSSPM